MPSGPCCAPSSRPTPFTPPNTMPPARPARSHTLVTSTGLPFTTKTELVADQAASSALRHEPHLPSRTHTRCHRPAHQRRSLALARYAGELGLDDRQLANHSPRRWCHSRGHNFLRFSFGPFIGFWLAFEAGVRLGLPLPARRRDEQRRAAPRHSRSSGDRPLLHSTYALHLAEVATPRDSLSPTRR